MAIVYDKLLALKIPDVERTYTQARSDLLCTEPRLRSGPDERGPASVRAGERSEGAADLSGRGRAARHVGARTRHRHRLGEDRARRARGGDSQAAAAGRHGHEPHARARRRSTRGRARARWSFRSARCYDKATGDLSPPSRRRASARGDGGFGGPQRPTPAPHAIPERAPDAVCDLPTRPEMALIYRWNADMNPLHADPAIARRPAFRARSCTGSRPSALRATRS